MEKHTFENRIFDDRRFEPSVGVASRGDRVSDRLSAARTGTTDPPRRLRAARRHRSGDADPT
ncbi:unnamed protein product [Nesidiocoris tenuis]|uniref:Uncharacterized protein n=1 Tax=Nesidiocoris tenuis TaxID=355587 RepID=A0A6H5H838_9HEMI|nr:unnamed protein product [Nesidiocoris tenuis]